MEKWIDNWGNFRKWKKNLINKSTHNTLPTIRELFDLQIETMNSRQMAKAWSAVTFLIKNHRTAFVEYARKALAPYRGERKLPSEKAWKMAFGKMTPEFAEKEWRAWIVQQPGVPGREDKLALPLAPKKGKDTD